MFTNEVKIFVSFIMKPGYVDAVKDYLDLESRAPSPTSVSLPHSGMVAEENGYQPVAKKLCSGHQHDDIEQENGE